MTDISKALIDERIKHIKGLMQAGKPEFAQFESAKLVAQYPDNVMALCLMTYIFYINNDPKNALRYAKFAYAKTSSDSAWQDIVSASNALLMVGEMDEANNIMLNLDVGKISNVGDLSYIAKHYGSLDQVEAAAKIFETISDGALDFHSRQMFGVALLYLGRFDEARLQFEKAIELNPMDGVSYNQISVLKVAEGRAERIAAMEKALVNPALDAVNRSYLHFSMFNEFDAVKNTDAAWDTLVKANDVRRATIHQDNGHDLEASQGIIEAYGLIPKSTVTADATAVPVFILGLPRTGTTLLEKILSSFKEVQACGELRAFRRELELATNTNFMNPFGFGLQANIPGLDYGHIGREYLRKNAWRHPGKRFFTDKEPSNYAYAGLIAKAIPEAKIIHIRRNPMDACFSNYKQFFGPSSFTYSYRLSDIAEHYRIYDRMMQFWRSQIPDSMLEIKYESLVADPDSQAERIRKFCGFETASGNPSGQSEYVTSTLSAAQVRAPIHKGNVNSWEKYREQLNPLYETLREYIEIYDKELLAEAG